MKNLFRRLWLHTLAALLLMLGMGAGCSGGGERASGDQAENVASAPAIYEEKLAAADGAGQTQGEVAPPPPGSIPTAPIQRQIVYTGRLRVQVERADSAARRARAIVTRAGGYLAGEQASSAEASARQTELTLRVPAARFEAVMNELAGLGVHTAERSQTASDVTEEFIDVEARLRVQREREAAYLATLRQARRVQDILEIQKYLSETREQIEAAEGRLRYLRSQVSLSTITVTYYEPVGSPASPDTGLGYRVGQALQNGWDLLEAIVVGPFTIWPLLLLGLILFIVLRRRVARSLKEGGEAAPRTGARANPLRRQPPPAGPPPTQTDDAFRNS